MNEPEYVKISDVKLGPIRHETLPPQLLEAIKAIYDLIGPYLTTDLEEFEIGFMRDMHPEREVAVWSSIAGGWLLYHQKHLAAKRLPVEEEEHLVTALIVISCGSTYPSMNRHQMLLCNLR
jgi:hypothetical protein